MPVGPASDLHRVPPGLGELDRSLRKVVVDIGRAGVAEISLRGIAVDLDESAVAVVGALGPEPSGIREVQPAAVGLVALHAGRLAHPPLEGVGACGGDVDFGGDDVAVVRGSVVLGRGQSLPDDVLAPPRVGVLLDAPGARQREVLGLDDHDLAAVATAQATQERCISQRSKQKETGGGGVHFASRMPTSPSNLCLILHPGKVDTRDVLCIPMRCSHPCRFNLLGAEAENRNHIGRSPRWSSGLTPSPLTLAAKSEVQSQAGVSLLRLCR